MKCYFFSLRICVCLKTQTNLRRKLPFTCTLIRSSEWRYSKIPRLVSCANLFSGWGPSFFLPGTTSAEKVCKSYITLNLNWTQITFFFFLFVNRAIHSCRWGWQRNVYCEPWKASGGGRQWANRSSHAKGRVLFRRNQYSQHGDSR